MTEYGGEEAQESLFDAGASADPGKGLVDNEIEALLGAVLAQGIDVLHGNSPQESGLGLARTRMGPS